MRATLTVALLFLLKIGCTHAADEGDIPEQSLLQESARIEDGRARLKRRSSCTMGSSLDVKVAFSERTCGECLDKNKGSWGGEKCRFSGFPFLDQGSDESAFVPPRVYNQKFLNLAEIWLKGDKVKEITKATLKDNDIVVDEDFFKSDGVVIPKLTNAYRPKTVNGDIQEADAKHFQCFKNDHQSDGNVEGEAALKSEAPDSNGKVAIKYHDKKGIKTSFNDHGIEFNGKTKHSWECDLESNVRSAWYRWRRAVIGVKNSKDAFETAEALQEAAKVTTESPTASIVKEQRSPTSVAKSGDQKSASGAETAMSKLGQFENFFKNSKKTRSALEAIAPLRKGVAEGDPSCPEQTVTQIVQSTVAQAYVRCNTEAGPVVEPTEVCKDFLVQDAKKICDTFSESDCFWNCAGKYFSKAAAAFTSPVLLN